MIATTAPSLGGNSAAKLPQQTTNDALTSPFNRRDTDPDPASELSRASRLASLLMLIAPATDPLKK